MRTRRDVIAVARSQVGYTEQPPGSNRTKYGQWYGLDGQPWCAIFVSWTLRRAGFRHSLYRGHYTPEWADRFKKAGRWRTTPRRGDLAFFNFPDSVHRIQHVGIVARVNDDGTIRTIEGNTSSSNSGSQDNGGGVFVRTRPRSHVVGYGRPGYLVPSRIAGRLDAARAVVERLARRLAYARRQP